MPINNSQYTLLLITSSFSDPGRILKILQEANFKLLEAMDQEEAVQKIRTTSPDLILMDIDKSVKQDNSLLQDFKTNRITGAIPVLFITSMTNENHIPECLNYDNIDFIIKPFRPQELVIRIQHQLSLLRAERVIRKQNEKLKNNLEARDKLYSIIAHDLRAPISTIKMINSSIETQKEKITDPQILKRFEMINETTEEAFNLLENLLRWTRNQNGKTKIYATTFNLAHIIRQVFSLFNSIASAKNIELINHAEAQVQVYADEDMIKTVLRNLISNAIKFTYTGGKIEISVSNDEGCVKVCVKDNGKGIPQNIQSHLLKSNECITTYGTHNEKGCGLGLILCRDFIKMNKGKLTFCSQEGVGSTFCFTLPPAQHPEERR